MPTCATRSLYRRCTDVSLLNTACFLVTARRLAAAALAGQRTRSSMRCCKTLQIAVRHAPPAPARAIRNLTAPLRQRHGSAAACALLQSIARACAPWPRPTLILLHAGAGESTARPLIIPFSREHTRSAAGMLLTAHSCEHTAMQAGNIPAEFLPPEKFKEKAYIKDGESVRARAGAPPRVA